MLHYVQKNTGFLGTMKKNVQLVKLEFRLLQERSCKIDTN